MMHIQTSGRILVLGLAIAGLALAPNVTEARTYWFESYQRVVELIDEAKPEEASLILEQLIEERPYPEATIRVPGNRFMDYLPYYQRARIEMMQGEFGNASRSLDVSEAFGAIKRNRRAMADMQDRRRELTTHQTTQVGSQPEVSELKNRASPR